MLPVLAFLLGFLSTPLTLPQDRSSVDSLVLGCDRIVRAKIASIHEFPRGTQRPEGGGDPALEEQMIRVLELAVEETYWGRAEEKSLFVLDDTFYSCLRLHGRPEKGEVSIWFLELDPWFDELNPLPRGRISKLIGSAGLQVVDEDGLGRLRIEQTKDQSVVCLHDEVWNLPPALPVLGKHASSNPVHRNWLEVAQPVFEQWLRKTIRESTPSLRVDVVSTSPRISMATVDRFGRVELIAGRSGSKSADIGTDGLRKLLEIAASEHFFELPCQLGESRYPDSAIYLLRIRTEQGGRQIRLHGPADPKNDSAARLEAHARAMRVWDAIPLVREWKITGH